MGSPEEHEAVARRLFDAVVAGDVDTVLATYADDVEMRINISPDPMGAAEIAGLIAVVQDKIPDFRYENIRCEGTATGFVEQHHVCGTSPAGEAFEVPLVAVGTVENGRVVKLLEYADSAGMAKMGLF